LNHEFLKKEYTLECQLEIKESYFELVFEGEFNRNQFIGSLKKVLEEYRQIDCNRMLINMNEVDFTYLTAMDRFFLGKDGALLLGYQGPLGRVLKVAALVPNEIYTGFAETVAKNRGAFVDLYFERSKALEWLLQN
jgi:hypothetical protein